MSTWDISVSLHSHFTNYEMCENNYSERLNFVCKFKKMKMKTTNHMNVLVGVK